MWTYWICNSLQIIEYEYNLLNYKGLSITDTQDWQKIAINGMNSYVLVANKKCEALGVDQGNVTTTVLDNTSQKIFEEIYIERA